MNATVTLDSLGIDRENPELLRAVLVAGYTLVLWDDAPCCEYMSQHRLRYLMADREGRVLFEGADFGCSPMHAIDSDECLRALLGFLTLKPGDTDDEYFSNYTKDQMAFAEGDAEELSLWAIDEEMYGHPALAWDVDLLEAASR